jgi:hypothetical protein
MNRFIVGTAWAISKLKLKHNNNNEMHEAKSNITESQDNGLTNKNEMYLNRLRGSHNDCYKSILRQCIAKLNNNTSSYNMGSSISYSLISHFIHYIVECRLFSPLLVFSSHKIGYIYKCDKSSMSFVEVASRKATAKLNIDEELHVDNHTAHVDLPILGIAILPPLYYAVNSDVPPHIDNTSEMKCELVEESLNSKCTKSTGNVSEPILAVKGICFCSDRYISENIVGHLH